MNETQEPGDDPVTFVSADVFDELLKSLAEVERGETEYLGDFSQYAGHEDE